MSATFQDTLLQALLPRLRLQAAQYGLIGLPQPQESALTDWLKSLPRPTAEGHQPLDELAVSVTADFKRWTWRAAGDPAAFIPVMAAYLPTVGAAQPELDRLGQVGAQLEPAQLGYWLEMKEAGLNAGWYLPAPLSLAQARLALPAHAASEAVLEWAATHQVGPVSRLGRAMGAGSPYSELLLPLPNPADVEAQVYAGVQLFEQLKAQRPPDEALGLLMNLENSGLSVSVWLSEQGAVKVGLLAAQPRTALVIELCQLAGASHPEPLAAFEGILGVTGPAYVECQTRATGFGVEMHYQLDLEISAISKSIGAARSTGGAT